MNQMSKTRSNPEKQVDLNERHCSKSNDLRVHTPVSVRNDYPELMTEEELVAYLRISEISNSKDYHNVIEHLKRFRGLPRLHICNKALYPKKAIQLWVKKETTCKIICVALWQTTGYNTPGLHEP